MKQSLNRYTIILIAAISLLCASNIKWGGNRWKEIVAFDGKGYCAYLPAIFIYDDLHFAFHDSIEKKYAIKNTYYEYRVIKENGVVDKYYAGTAFMQLPFFIVANLITKITGEITDGYSFIYQLAISIAGIFYGLIGLYLLRRLFRIYAISESIISIVLIALFFGTHLFYYCVLEPSLSHVYSFAAITAFVLILKKYTLRQNRKYLILSGFLLGVIVLIRPVNGLIIFILPFLSGDKENFFKTIKAMFKKNSGILFSILLFLVIISIQGIIHFVQTGQIYIYSYTV